MVVRRRTRRLTRPEQTDPDHDGQAKTTTRTTTTTTTSSSQARLVRSPRCEWIEEPDDHVVVVVVVVAAVADTVVVVAVVVVVDVEVVPGSSWPVIDERRASFGSCSFSWMTLPSNSLSLSLSLSRQGRSKNHSREENVVTCQRFCLVCLSFHVPACLFI